jgi:hypothetical protein
VPCDGPTQIGEHGRTCQGRGHSMKTEIGLLLSIAAGLCASSDAWANGRFPRADQLVATPGRPEHLVLRTTFGLLTSRDAGASWEWICERSVGFSGPEDPAVAVLGGGRLLAGLSAGLAHASDPFCSWQFAQLSVAPVEIVDLTVRPLDPLSAVALAWERTDANAFGYRSLFFTTIDAGATWESYGTGIDPSALVLTVDVAASDPRRLYASGIRPAARTAALFVSTDDAQTWSERPAPFDSPREQGFYIAGVDPLAPERVYLRSSGANVSRLFVTGDAGLSFEQLFSGRELLGFALSPDGAQVYVGGPAEGLWGASRDELVFEQRSSIPILCLMSGASLLYACSNEQLGFALGASSDGGRQFAATLHLSEVRGPVACPPETSGGVCAAEWPAIAERIGIPPERGAAPSGEVDPDGAPAAAHGRCSVGSARSDGSSCIEAVFTVSVGVLSMARRARRPRRSPT